VNIVILVKTKVYWLVMSGFLFVCLWFVHYLRKSSIFSSILVGSVCVSVCLSVCRPCAGRISGKMINHFRPVNYIFLSQGIKLFWPKLGQGQTQGHENVFLHVFGDNFANIRRIVMRFFASDSSSKINNTGGF